MAVNQKKRRVYWLTRNITSMQRERSSYLAQNGYQVEFFETLDELISASARNRAGIIVVSDEGDLDEVEHALQVMVQLPELYGARMILCSSQPSRRLRYLAAGNAFRDIIPSDLDHKSWFSRFVYATAGQDLRLALPAPQVTLNSIAAVHVPARVVWISPKRVFIECRMRPPRGTVLGMSGPLAQRLGVKSLTLKTLDNKRSQLKYRFSDGSLSAWTVPRSFRDKVNDLFTQLNTESTRPSWKIFVAIQDTSLRSDVLRKLMHVQFDIKTALQKHSIVEEPKFLGPDAVIIEDTLCIGDYRERFLQMLDALDPGVPIIILGRNISDESLTSPDDHGGIYILPRVPDHLAELLIEQYLDQRSQKGAVTDVGARFLAADNPLSYAEIKVSARITQLHPRSAQISVPVQLNAFGLVRLESPMLLRKLGTTPYAKILECYGSPSNAKHYFPFIADTYLCDLNRDQTKNLAKGLIKAFSEKLMANVTGDPDESSGKLDTSDLDDGNYEPQPEPSELMPTLEVETKEPIQIQDSPTAKSAAITTEQKKPEEEASHESDPVDLGQLVAVSVASVSQSTIEVIKEVWSNKTVKYMVTFIVISIFGAVFLWGSVKTLSKYYEKSGKEFTESLERMRNRGKPPR